MNHQPYLYTYVVIEKTNGNTLAEYKSNLIPPAIGSKIDIAEFMNLVNRNPVFRIVDVQYQPFKSEELEASSNQMLILLFVAAEYYQK